MQVAIIIDGQRVQIERGAPIIDAAKRLGIAIPTLCYHEALKPYGSCRLCMVEVTQNRQTRLVTSCNFPIESGMEVLTDTPRLRKIRRTLVELLLARCGDVPQVKALAKKMGVETVRFRKKEAQSCILCGLCVRFCDEVVGVGAIGLSNRGTEREITTPFKAPSDSCIGCGSCTYICPTGCIEMVPDEVEPHRRRMKMGGLNLTRCPYGYECGSCATDREFLEELKKVVGDFRSHVKNRN